MFGTPEFPRSSASLAARMLGYWSQSSSMKMPGRPASPPRRSGSLRGAEPARPSSAVGGCAAPRRRSREAAGGARLRNGAAGQGSDRAMLSSEAIPGTAAAPPHHHAPLTTHPTSDARLASLLPAALVSLLRSASDRPRNGAAALKSLAKRDPNAAKAMVSAGAVPALVDLLQVDRDATPPARPPTSLLSRPTFPFRRRVSRSPRARGRCCVRSAVTCRKCGSRGGLVGVATS